MGGHRVGVTSAPHQSQSRQHQRGGGGDRLSPATGRGGSRRRPVVPGFPGSGPWFPAVTDSSESGSRVFAVI